MRAYGHEVDEAFDGPSCIEAALKHKPHVIFLVIGLPKMNGFDVARRLRQEEALKGVVVVAMTGFGDQEQKVKCKEAGFDRHFLKPTNIEDITKLLDEVAEKLK